MRVRSERRCMPASLSCSALYTLACNGAFESGTSPKPATPAAAGARPLTVTGSSCAVDVCAQALHAARKAVAQAARGAMEMKDGWLLCMLPCARITSIRFKGTFSVERPEAVLRSVQHPQRMPRSEPRGDLDYGIGLRCMAMRTAIALLVRKAASRNRPLQP